MVTVALIKAKLRNHSITVKVDARLIDTVRDKYPVDSLANNEFQIPINLYRLIMNIGTIQSLYFEPTNRQKFMDRMYMIEKIHDDDRLLIKIQDIRDRLGSEKLGDFSEDFGIGLALCVADYLYKINPTTVVPIRATNKRPDIKCFTMENEELIIESKGYSNRNNLNGQRMNAINQKRSRTADVRVVSLTLINETDSTSTEFVDPPAKPSGEDIEKRKRMLMAEHYSAVFNFIGQKELSRYYRLMRNKIKNQQDYRTVNEKEELFYKIKDTYVYIYLNNKQYYGTLEKVKVDTYSFLGVENRLLYFDGFLHFEGYEEERSIESEGNHFHIFEDGIVIGEIKNLTPFSPRIEKYNIKHYQDFTTITDIDSMDSLHFEEFLKYLFELNNIRVVFQKQYFEDDRGFDFVIVKNNVEIFVEVKHIKNPKGYFPNLSKEHRSQKNTDTSKYILITNADMLPSFESQVMVIDRNQLKKIISKPDILGLMLENG
jgi:hypothetical protein